MNKRFEMKPLHIFAAALVAAPAGIAALPQAAQACHPWNPVCNKPWKPIRKPIKKIKKGWVKGRDGILRPIKGHACKQYLLNVKRSRIGGSSVMSRFPVASRWLINSGQVTAAELRNAKIYFSSRIINAPALVYGGDIYINSRNMGSYKRKGMKTALMIAHEMEHVRQFRRYGSTEKFCAAYESQVASHGNFVDFHRLGGLEVAAGKSEYRFARWVLDRTKLPEMSRAHNVPFMRYRMAIGKGRERVVSLPRSLPTEDQYARFVNAGHTTAMPNVPVPDRLRPNTDPRMTDPGFQHPLNPVRPPATPPGIIYNSDPHYPMPQSRPAYSPGGSVYNTDPRGWSHPAPQPQPVPPQSRQDLGGAINGLIDALRNR